MEILDAIGKDLCNLTGTSKTRFQLMKEETGKPQCFYPGDIVSCRREEFCEESRFEKLAIEKVRKEFAHFEYWVNNSWYCAYDLIKEA